VRHLNRWILEGGNKFRYCAGHQTISSANEHYQIRSSQPDRGVPRSAVCARFKHMNYSRLILSLGTLPCRSAFIPTSLPNDNQRHGLGSALRSLYPGDLQERHFVEL
jgi:hypothetical protein